MFVWDRGAQIGKVTSRVRAILPQHFRQEQDMPNGRFLLRRHIRMGKFRQWRNGASCRQGTHLDPGRICSSLLQFRKCGCAERLRYRAMRPLHDSSHEKDRQIKAHVRSNWIRKVPFAS